MVFLSGLSVGTEQNNPARRWFDVFIGEILPSFCLSGKGGNAPFRNLEGVQEGERVAHLEPGLFFSGISGVYVPRSRSAHSLLNN